MAILKSLSAHRLSATVAVGVGVGALCWAFKGDQSRRRAPTFESIRRVATAETHRGIKGEAWQDSARLFPYQAVRLRSRVSNPGSLTLARSAPTDGFFHSCGVGRGRTHDPLSGSCAVVFHDYDAYSTGQSPREAKNGQGFALLPGECRLSSEAIAAYWTRNKTNAREPIIAPIFSEIGEYHIHGTIALNHRTRQSQHISVTVHVVEPEGDEWRAYKAVKSDHALRVAIVSPVNAPPAKAVEPLQAFIREFGGTSYGDYARFALARYYMGGSGEGFRNRQGTAAQLTKSILWVQGLPDRTNAVESHLRGWCKNRPRRVAAVDDAIAEIVAAVDRPRPNLEAAVEKLVKLTQHEEDMPAAIELLEQIRKRGNKGFAYMPNALVALKVALEFTNSQRAAEVRDILLSEYPDALVVLEEMAREIPDEDWRSFRVRRCPGLPTEPEKELRGPHHPPLTFEFERVSAPPYPYQAVRLRWRVENQGRFSLEPRVWSDRWFEDLKALVGSSAGAGSQYRLVVFRDGAGRGQSEARPWELNNGAGLPLAPGESLATTAALAARWTNNAGLLQIASPVFPRPGMYHADARYLLDPPSQTHLTLSAQIDVRQPRGREALACETVERDVPLRDALLSPIGQPPLDVVPKLRDFLAEYGDTSYANYARFALARHHLGGSGDQLRRNEHQLTALLATLRGARLDARSREDAEDSLNQWAREVGRRSALSKVVGAVRRAWNDSDEEFERSLGEVARLSRISKPDRDAAVSLLEEMRTLADSDFAYLPNALVALKVATEPDDRPRSERIAELLRKDYADSVEALDELAYSIPADQWAAFRVKRATTDASEQP